MSIIEILVGRGWGQRAVIIFAVVLYLYLSFKTPSIAKESAFQSIRMFAGLITLIFAAMMIANAVGNLIQPEMISGFIGEASGIKGVFLGGFLGGVLPGGPYATYPIINELYEGGASLASIMAMVIGWSILGITRVPYGLAILDPKIVGLRYLLGVPALIIICLVAYLVL